MTYKEEETAHVALTEPGVQKIEGMLRQPIAYTTGSLLHIQNVGLVHHVNQALRAHKLLRPATRLLSTRTTDHHHRRVHMAAGMRSARFGGLMHQATLAKEGVHCPDE